MPAAPDVLWNPYAPGSAGASIRSCLPPVIRPKGEARDNLDAVDLFALTGALGWLGDQRAFAPRADQLFDIIAGAIVTKA